MPLSVMPLGSSVHCVELYAGRGAQMVRSAGASAQVMACLLYTSDAADES